MKTKNLLFAAIAAILLISCNKETVTIKTFKLSPTSINTYAYETTKLAIIPDDPNAYVYPIKWTITDDFVAEVDDIGYVKGLHIGNATIEATNNYGGHAICNVTVKPRYNLYEEPCTNWGATKQEIKKLYGTPVQEQDNALAYIVNQNKGIIMIYTFDDNGRLYAAVASRTYQKSEDLNEIKGYLNERYEFYQTLDSNLIYGNKMKPENATLIVALNSNDYENIIVLYTPNQGVNNAPQYSQIRKILNK